ncbi:MAG: radical SAM protein [Acidilobaceae archaeon]
MSLESFGFKRVGSFYNRPLFKVGAPTPLIGHIAFGIIDRGTNVVQIRPTTLCPYSCVFCSVDAGPFSKWRQAEFIVDTEWLYRHAIEVAKYKGGKSLEALIDGVGEPLTHSDIVRLIKLLKDSGLYDRVAIETRGGLLTKEIIIELEKAGLDRINLSIDSTDPTQAKELTGAKSYDVAQVLELVAWTLENTKIDVILTPVVIPGVNEKEMIKIIEWAKRHKAGEKSSWPSGVLIQKYEVHRYGRKIKNVRPWSWSKFYEWLAELERTTGYRLIVSSKEIGIESRPQLPKPFKKGDVILGIVLGPGWHKGEYLVVDRGFRRLIAVFPARELSPGESLRVKIEEDADNIYVATV